ncbi:hypothetical protein, partial [Klebsiella pneumoniae]|uniref:hypothetical protein n=1 Tax=Klebsiella pneumoniae TaxID=573 RepID=UPI003F523BB5
LKFSLTLLLLAGCSGSNPVNVSTLFGPSIAVQRTAGIRQGLTAAATPAVRLERVRMVVRHVKLEHETQGKELEIATGPFLLDLAGAELTG